MRRKREAYQHKHYLVEIALTETDNKKERQPRVQDLIH